MIVSSDGVAVSRIIPYYIVKQIKNIEEADWLSKNYKTEEFKRGY